VDPGGGWSTTGTSPLLPWIKINILSVVFSAGSAEADVG